MVHGSSSAGHWHSAGQACTQRQHAPQRAMVVAKLATMRQGERTDLASIEGRSKPLISQPAAADEGYGASLLLVPVATVEHVFDGLERLRQAIKDMLDRGNGH